MGLPGPLELIVIAGVLLALFGIPAAIVIAVILFIRNKERR